MFSLPVFSASPAKLPTTVFLSPELIDVPAFLPIKVLFSASVPENESPAPDPPTVLLCASDERPPTALPSAFTKLVAVTMPDITAPPSEKLTPIPGILR